MLHALTDDQVRSLKNLCDRAMVFVLLATGLRREELVQLDLEQLDPHTPEALRAARRAQIDRVRGKGQTERMVFLSADARTALADYLEHERPQDAAVAGREEPAPALFLSAAEVASRTADGRLSPRAINQILLQIGRWHDAELDDPQRHLSPLRPHDLRHTFAFQLARRSQRYIQRYTNPPAHIAATYIEKF